RTMGRVMHEFKHGELKRGPGGKAGKVKSPRQAVAIALKEAGASKYQSKSENIRNRAKTERKEARGETAQQGQEGRFHIGARGKRESTPAMGGGNAGGKKMQGRGAGLPRGRDWGGTTKRELYARARERGIPGRSKMSKRQLENALR
ncbi:MAG: hypothetical protein J2P49_07480, partial [Methylocapsa sp.]|nr:hypothetical protein [Methylocapsa sp.]